MEELCYSMGGRSDDYIDEALVSVKKRSSRKAGVLLGCNMQYHGSRLLLISFAIVFALGTSTVSGFIIRELETWDVTTDSDTEGSDLLEVWSDLKTPNKTKVNEDLSDKVIALNSLKNTTTKIIGKVLSTPIIINPNREEERPTPSVALELRGNLRSDFASTETTYDVYSSSEAINGNWDFKNDLNKVKEIENTKDSQNIESHPKSKSNIESIKNNQPRVSSTQGLVTAGVGYYKQTTGTKPFTDSIDGILDGILVEVAINSTESTTNDIDVEPSTESKDKTVSTNDCTDNAPSSAVLTEDVTLEMVDMTTTNQLSKNTETTTEPQHVESFSTETGTDAPITTTFPTWKNYKTINRRPTTSKKEITEESTALKPKIMDTESVTNVLENPPENSSIRSVSTQEDTYFTYQMMAMAITEDVTPELETTTPADVKAGLQTTNLDMLLSNLGPNSTSQNKLTLNLHTRQTTLNVQTSKLTSLLETTTSTLDTISRNSIDSKLDKVLDNFITHNANWKALDTQLLKYDSKPENSNTQKPIMDTTLANLNTQISTSVAATTNMDTIVTDAKATLDSRYSTPANPDTEMSMLNNVLGKLETPTTNGSQRNEWMTKFDNKVEKLQAHMNRQSSISDTDLKQLDVKMAKSKTIPVNTNTETTKYNTNMSKLDIKSMENLEVVSSKRAGYLDNSETTTMTLSSEHGTTAIIMSNKDDIKDSFATMYGGEESYGELNESPKNKKLKNTTADSQRQLEDAIEEELLIEKILSNHKMLPPNSSPPTDDNSSSMQTYMLNNNNGSEKRNISTLYTPSPNYKPAKKLDVQHLKQFVRDPDDNSWRNESISSLGIVFKPKNASKSFTEVLKNKTTELNSITNPDNKTNVPVLRFRLEKMTELRKSKKKKNDSSDAFYGDYEDMSGEVISPLNEERSVTTTLPASITKYGSSINDIYSPKINIFEEITTSSQKLRKNTALVSDYYDSTDEYEADYAVIPKMELKKFKSKDNVVGRPPGLYTTRSMDAPATPLSTYPPNRQATVQYFPPTKKVTEKVVVNQYDDGFNMRLNQYTYTETSNPVSATIPSIIPKTQSRRPEENVSLKSQQTESSPENFGNINKASYIIRHYKDFINNAAIDSDEDRSAYMPYTERPAQREATGDLAKLFNVEYERALMERFVDNFNRNSERFKVDFPILYNTSVVHRKEDDNGRVLASSTAIYKRLYESAHPRSSVIVTANPCTSNCENINVDLSPAYELHYYVPEQEEKEEMNPNQPVDTQLNRYRL